MIALAGTSAAQVVSQQVDMSDSTAVQETIVVTGTRGQGRAALESSAPISVLDSKELSDLGFGDLSRAMMYVEPSINYPRAATTATTANSRPITLRGLSPDQTLVLVNGKRRHATSILNINNTVGRGSAGVDFDILPTTSVQRVEVLRDGAAAQYGSDAIAGVVNVILREADQGGMAFVQGGVTEEGDGGNVIVGGWAGHKLADDGFVTLSGEYRNQDSTNRANIDQRFDRVTYQIGDPDIEVGSLAINAGLPFLQGELYGFATVSRKDSVNPAGFRTPDNAPEIFPNGYLPKINAVVTDYSVALGWRKEWDSGWLFDLSNTFGSDKAEFSVFETVNRSLGESSPTEFNSGAVQYEQNTTDLVLSRAFDSLGAGGNVAFGAQYRHESYKSDEGQESAFSGSGADGFAGFSPAFHGSRGAIAGFVDVEFRPVEPLLLSGAVRHDDYDDFGSATTWRAAGRYDFTDWFAIRTSVGTGFRAPSLQQQQFQLVSGALNSSGQLTTVGTLPVDHPVAQLLGAQSLQAETSDNFSAGFVVRNGNLSFTADWFTIDIDDRIVLSEQFGGQDVTDILLAAGITNFQQVRFFSNATDTTTEGYEFAFRWNGDLTEDAKLGLSLGYAHSETDLKTLRPNVVLPSQPYLQNRSITFLTRAQPEDKATVEADLDFGAVSLQANGTWFGPYDFSGFGNTLVQEIRDKIVIDLSGSWQINDRISLNAGVQNIGDTYPDQPVFNSLGPIIAATGGSFPSGEETPIGLNGRTYFVRLSASF
jgi:iron complex outermembrane receptor protein